MKKYMVILTLLILTACTTETINTEIREGNEPYFLINNNSKDAILLVHGFTASPWETRELGDFLFNNNYTVYGTRLAAHGTSKEHLKSSTWQQWYTSLETDYGKLNNYQNVYIVGVSLGADLSLILASNNKEIKKVITLGAPMELKNKQSKLAGIAKYFLEYADTNLTENEKNYYYNKRPIAAVHQLNKAMKAAKKSLPYITQPVLILQATDDPTVKPESAEYIYANINSNKQLIYYDVSKHVLLQSTQKEKVFNDIIEYIEN
jgi:carboxylesterase